MLELAVEISEDVVGDRFKISTAQWKRYRYDIKSLRDLSPEEITDLAYAQILRYAQPPSLRTRVREWGEYYKICIQDHVILRTIQSEPELELFPFLIYVVTHELIHVVRFARFLQSFYASEQERIQEESRVHEITHELLCKLPVRGIEKVLHFFHGSMQVELFEDEKKPEIARWIEQKLP
ncbi:hypothetical protein [Thermodesulforhabdus norvegica]|uniref:Uncharacterized protein n=1 Tax=Thermodesulforhabdus norvegica TaxID=39841 RepID=A0A1I4VR07_9BACT|nr:hypothetical protein [Thermodesulforhabdus norvegica]SFN03704.1 hypothetical protein SAMN05660836_02416 [Thermodesulforhabdus norvegica]